MKHSKRNFLGAALFAVCTLFALSTLSGSPALAKKHRKARVFGSNTLSIVDPWARATPPMATTGAAYFIIQNKGAADTLVSVSTPVAAAAELHLSSMAGGMMKMEQQQSVLIPAKGEVRFKQGGLHVMMINLKRQLKPGEMIPLTLTFAKAGVVKMQVPVKKSRGGREMKGHGDMKMKKKSGSMEMKH